MAVLDSYRWLVFSCNNFSVFSRRSNDWTHLSLKRHNTRHKYLPKDSPFAQGFPP